MRSISSERTIPSAGLQVVLTILCGLSLVWMVGKVGPLMMALGLLGAIFLVLFLQRPDLGLLLTLIIRGASDAAIQYVVPAQGAVGLGGRLLTPNVALILIVILAGGLFLLSRRLPVIGLPGGTLLTFMLGIGLVGMLHSRLLLGSADRWLAVLSALVIYALAANMFLSPQRIQWVINTLAVSFAIPAVFGIYEVLHYFRWIPSGGYRAMGTFVTANSFGDYLIMILSVFVGQAFAHRGTRQGLARAIVIVSGILVFATGARASWTGMIIVLLTFGALRKPALLAIVPLAAILVFTMTPAATRVADPFSGGSFADRQDIWAKTYPIWLSQTDEGENVLSTALNRLAGTGPGSIRFLTFAARGIGYAAHNDYLLILFENGILGLLTFLLLFLTLIRFAYRTWRRSTNEAAASVALSFLALTLAYAVMGFTDNIWGYTQNQVYFWTLAGLTAAISQMPRHSNSGHTRPGDQQ